MKKRRGARRNLVFWGGTGQAKVMRFIAEFLGYRVSAVFDETADLEAPI